MSTTIRLGSGTKDRTNVATKFKGALNRGRRGGCASCRGKK